MVFVDPSHHCNVLLQWSGSTANWLCYVKHYVSIISVCSFNIHFTEALEFYLSVWGQVQCIFKCAIRAKTIFWKHSNLRRAMHTDLQTYRWTYRQIILINMSQQLFYFSVHNFSQLSLTVLQISVNTEEAFSRNNFFYKFCFCGHVMKWYAWHKLPFKNSPQHCGPLLKKAKSLAAICKIILHSSTEKKKKHNPDFSSTAQTHWLFPGNRPESP